MVGKRVGMKTELFRVSFRSYRQSPIDRCQKLFHETTLHGQAWLTRDLLARKPLYIFLAGRQDHSQLTIFHRFALHILFATPHSMKCNCRISYSRDDVGRLRLLHRRSNTDFYYATKAALKLPIG